MRLLLIRHGQTPANVRGELATARPGPGLTKLGRKQAQSIPDAVAGEQIAAVYVSPLTRTAETAAPLAASLGLDPQVLEGLEEIEAGDLEDRRDMPSVMVYVRTVFGWAAGDLDVRMPGADRRQRVLRALRRGDRGDRGAASGCLCRRRLARCRDPGLVGRAGREPRRRLHGATATWTTPGVVVLTGSPAEGWLAETWAGEPVGGLELVDHAAPDPLGDPIDEVG